MSNENQTSSVPSINDNLPTSNPSGKTVLLVLGGLAVGAFALLLYVEYFL